MKQRLTCKRPDVDSPRMVCGHPIPCPHHTVAVDLSQDPPTVTVAVDPRRPIGPALDRLSSVATALRDGLRSPRRKAGGGHG